VWFGFRRRCFGGLFDARLFRRHRRRAQSGQRKKNNRPQNRCHRRRANHNPHRPSAEPGDFISGVKIRGVNQQQRHQPDPR
jgi:hypothetical protein